MGTAKEEIQKLRGRVYKLSICVEEGHDWKARGICEDVYNSDEDRIIFKCTRCDLEKDADFRGPTRKLFRLVLKIARKMKGYKYRTSKE